MPRSEALQMRTGEEQRFESLFESHHRAVLSYCLGRLGRRDAEDFAAEVFATVWRRR